MTDSGVYFHVNVPLPSPAQKPADQPKIPASRFRQVSARTSRVKVAVVDSGWDRSIWNEWVAPGIGLVHPERELEFHISDDDNDRQGHGTACSSIVLSLAPECTIIPVRVFGTTLETSPSSLIYAIEWARTLGVKLINLSLGTARHDIGSHLYVACELARRDGVIIVAAATNTNELCFPAVFQPVIGVGASALDDLSAIDYRHGDAIECRLRTRRRPVRWLGNRERLADGTSFAAPVVTGLIALWLADDPTLDVEGVRNRLREAAVPKERSVAFESWNGF